MRLSDGTVVGLCYAFAMPLAQLYVLFRANEATHRLSFERKTILTMIGWSLVFMVPVAAAIWSVDWLFKGLHSHPTEGLDMSIAGLLAIAWAVTALAILAASAANRIGQATAPDAGRPPRLRPVLLGTAIGMVFSFIYIFGPHMLRG